MYNKIKRVISYMHQLRVQKHALLLEGIYWLYMLKVLVSHCIVIIIEETARLYVLATTTDMTIKERNIFTLQQEVNTVHEN